MARFKKRAFRLLVNSSSFLFPPLPPIPALNNNLKGFSPVLDETGKITGYKTDIGGADTVFPFSGKTKFAIAHSWGGSRQAFFILFDDAKILDFQILVNIPYGENCRNFGEFFQLYRKAYSPTIITALNDLKYIYYVQNNGGNIGVNDISKCEGILLAGEKIDMDSVSNRTYVFMLAE